MKTMQPKMREYQAPEIDVIECLPEQLVCSSQNGTLDPWTIETLD